MAKAKAKKRNADPQGTLGEALDAADSCCLAVDSAYEGFVKSEYLDKKQITKAIKLAEKAAAKLETLL